MGTRGQLQVAQLDGLLQEMRRQACRAAGPDVCRVLDRLRGQTGVHAALVAGDAGMVESATAGFPRQVLPPLASLLARLAGGQLGAAATQVEGLHLRCEALGSRDPCPVLVVASHAEPTPETVSLLSHTGSLLTLLLRTEGSDRTWRSYQHKARQVRFGVFHALVSGEPLLARRMTTGAVPPLLEAGRLRVHLLHCSAADRDRIERAHQDPSGYHGSNLMVQCPAFKEHLICLIAADDEVDGSHGPEQGRAASLHRLVRDNPRYALGVSGTHPLQATAEAYSQAAHALAAARTTPGRVAHYYGRTPLEGVLPRQPALDWARSLLRPLDSAPKTSADIARLAMTMPRSAVARLLDLSRNTVTAHIRHAERALGQDLADVRARAAVHLALALSSSCARPEADGHQPPPALGDLLRTEPANAWARTVLSPLETRHRRTLQAWIDSNTDAQQTALRMGINRNTVRAHLRVAEALLGLDLLTIGSGVHDVVHALNITDVHAS